VVRDDVVDPFVDIVELEDGSVVLDDERTGYIQQYKVTIKIGAPKYALIWTLHIF